MQLAGAYLNVGPLADRCLLRTAAHLQHQDFEEEINKVLSVLPRERRTFLFSATMTSKVAKLQRASLKDPVRVSTPTPHASNHAPCPSVDTSFASLASPTLPWTLIHAPSSVTVCDFATALADHVAADTHALS